MSLSGPRALRAVLLLVAVALVEGGLARSASAQSIQLAAPDEYTFLPYKNSESWPGRNFNGLDFLEPLVPVTSVERFDWGRVVTDTAVPYAFLAASLSIPRGLDKEISQEITRWGGWVAIDVKYDTFPVVLTYCAIGGLSLFLPAAEDAYGYSWQLRLDRFTVFALGMIVSPLERELLIHVYDVPRPNGSHYTAQNDARPAGHIMAVYASMAFLSEMLREWIRPEEEESIPVRVAEELALLLPYAAGVYPMFERIHAHKHTLVDCFAGAALGAFTMDLFYYWSFNERIHGKTWLQTLDLAVAPQEGGFMLALAGRF